jgi:methylmalonyl-CoA mutase C-terminal domain/subunit
MTVLPNIFAGPKREGAEDMIVVGGGVMHAEDVAALKKMGVKKVMQQDTPSQKIIDTLKKPLAERRPR